MHYPRVEINLDKFRHNAKTVIDQCREKGIEVAGVIKGFNGIPELTAAYARSGCSYIASSRLDHLEAAKKAGVDKPLMLIRIPMLTELERAADLAQMSLHSETETVIKLNDICSEKGITHKVILMADLGDLREGYWDKEELVKAAVMIERELPAIELAGVGTNLGCYGSIEPDTLKLQELVDIAETIEKEIGRELEYISGGATSSLLRLIENNMPERINFLRLGEGVILARDLQELWGYDMSHLYQDVFTLKAEVIEVKDKPTHPVGNIMFDAFGNRPEYTDRGIRRRALLAIGKVDYAFLDEMLPREKGIELIGASSDHTIVDVEDAQRDIKVGDIMEFDLCYATLVYVTNCPDVEIAFV